MNKIVFAGVTYDVDMLMRVANQGYRKKVKHSEVNAFSSYKNAGVLVGYEVNGKMHLLTGTLHTQLEEQEINVISKHILKKALVPVTTHQERRSQPSYEGNWRWGNDKRPQSDGRW